jgi:hypothetical protein
MVQSVMSTLKLNALRDALAARGTRTFLVIRHDHIVHEWYAPGFGPKDPDPFSISRDEAPIIFSPGASYAYSNPGMAMLAYAVTASLKGAPQSDIFNLLQERVMRPIGVPDDEWSIGYGLGYELDALVLYANWGGGVCWPTAVN